MNNYENAKAGLRAHVSGLNAELAALRAERDELKARIERMCRPATTETLTQDVAEFESARTATGRR